MTPISGRANGIAGSEFEHGFSGWTVPNINKVLAFNDHHGKVLDEQDAIV